MLGILCLPVVKIASGKTFLKTFPSIIYIFSNIHDTSPFVSKENIHFFGAVFFMDMPYIF